MNPTVLDRDKDSNQQPRSRTPVSEVWIPPAYPGWSEVVRWTDPQKSWGCAQGDGFNAEPLRPYRPISVRPHRHSDSDSNGVSDIASAPFGERNGDRHAVAEDAGAVQSGGYRPSFVPLNVFLGETVTYKRLKAPVEPEPVSEPYPMLVWSPAFEPMDPDETTPSIEKMMSKPAKKRSPWRHVRRFAGFVCVLLILVAVTAAFWGAGYIDRLSDGLPPLPADPSTTLPQTTTILASDGTNIGTLFGERRTWVELEEMGAFTVSALLAAEDHRFHEHFGVDYKRFVGAAWSTLNGDPEGASTIPMQLARNYFPELKQHSLARRKTEEVLLAKRIDAAFTKDQTLAWYLNTVTFGNNSFGIEAAAQRYYSKSAADLELHQAALLVGILKGPTRYDPFRRSSRAKDRRNVVLARMAALGMITSTQAADASAQPLEFTPSIYDPADSPAPYFVDYVKREAKAWAERAGIDLERDGLTIHTTLDLKMQALAEQAVQRQTDVLQGILNREFGSPGSWTSNRFWRGKQGVEADLIRRTAAYETLIQAGRSDAEALQAVRSDQDLVNVLRAEATRLQAAFVAMDPHSGQIKAWVGGHDYRTDQYDKVASARRQPGSIFKPIVFAKAVDRGFSPYYMVEDRIKTITVNRRGERWRPTNSGGGASGRLLTLEQGLAFSKNTVSVHLIQKLGPQAVVELAKDMGVSSYMLPVPSLALGTSETTLLEMTRVYATLAEYGVRRNATAITSITNRNGDIVATFPSEPDRVMSEQTAYTTLNMMRKVVDGGTGSFLRSRFGIRGDLAGKTGTTQNNADGWFMGVHPDLVMGAWVGFNDQRITFESNYWGQGGHNALLLVGDFLREARRGPGPILDNARFERPEGYRTPERPFYSFVSNDAPAEDEPSAADREAASRIGSWTTPVGVPRALEPARMPTRTPSIRIPPGRWSSSSRTGSSGGGP